MPPPHSVGTHLDTRLATAAKAYLLRAAYLEFPRGAGDIWYPDASERRPCCEALRRPTRMFPDGLRKHCMTYRHISALTGADEKDIKTAVRLARRLRRESSARAVVAAMTDIATCLPGTTIENVHQWLDTGCVPPVTPYADEILLAAAERR